MGTWVAQSVAHPTLAQVMISQLMSSSLALGSVLIARSLEPASDSVSPSLSAPPQLVVCLSLSLKKKIKCLKKKNISLLSIVAHHNLSQREMLRKLFINF